MNQTEVMSTVIDITLLLLLEWLLPGLLELLLLKCCLGLLGSGELKRCLGVTERWLRPFAKQKNEDYRRKVKIILYYFLKVLKERRRASGCEVDPKEVLSEWENNSKQVSSNDSKEWNHELETNYSFKEGRTLARKFNVSTKEQYISLFQNKDKMNYHDNHPIHRLPIQPNLYYKQEWKGWKDWLGIIYTFEKARTMVHSLNLTTKEQYFSLFQKKMNYDDDHPVHRLPFRPEVYYTQEWRGWDDWLRSLFYTFEQGKTIVHRTWSLQTKEEYFSLFHNKTKVKYEDDHPIHRLPFHPDFYYKQEWTHWEDWLGTATSVKENGPQPSLYHLFI